MDYLQQSYQHLNALLKLTR